MHTSNDAPLRMQVAPVKCVQRIWVGQGCTVDKKPAKGTWVQTERKAHEAWADLIQKHSVAASLMHRLVSQMDRRGAVIISQKTLAEMMGLHRNTIGRAIKVLERDNWIETVRLGAETGGVKAYLVNRRVAWADKRENQRFAAFDARVVVSAAEQPSETLRERPELRQLPRAGEYQLPTGDGSTPPSQPILGGMEPDLPATDTESDVAGV